MRKFTQLMLALALTFIVVGGANSQTVSNIVYAKDWTTATEIPNWYHKQNCETDYPNLTGNTFNILRKDGVSNSWDTQVQVANGISTIVGKDYTVRLRIKGTVVGTIACALGNWGDGNAETKYGINITTEFQNVDIKFTNAKVTDSWVMIWAGEYEGTLSIESVEVYCNSPLFYLYDYTGKDTFPWYHGDWGTKPTVSDGVLTATNDEVKGDATNYMFFVADGIYTEEGNKYIVRATVKGSDAGTIKCNFGTWSESKTLDMTLTDDYKAVDVIFTGLPTAGSNHVVFQIGKYVGTVSLKKIEVIVIDPDDPLASSKELLLQAIDLGNHQNSFAKTATSFQVLTNAIAAGQAELANASATTESLTAAKNAINDAIAGLKLQAGYANLTAEMFKQHEDDNTDVKEYDNPESLKYVLNEATDQPYGDPGVFWRKWADLTPYEQLIILTYGDTKPRFCMNRLENDGQQAATQADSKMIDINDNNGNTWSATAYQSIDGNKYTIDLTSIVDDYTFARLHAIKKQGWGDGVYVTDMLIYAEKSKATVGAAGYATFSSIMNVDMTGVIAYTAKYNSTSGKIELTPVTEVPANNAVIIEADAGTYELTNIESADALENNDLKISDGLVAGDGTIYVLAKKNDVVGFYKLAVDNKVPAGKAYLKITAAAPEFIGIGGTTGINATLNEGVEMTDGVIFDLSGRRVANPTKGIYIKNGKKFIVK